MHVIQVTARVISVIESTGASKPGVKSSESSMESGNGESPAYTEADPGKIVCA